MTKNLIDLLERQCAASARLASIKELRLILEITLDPEKSKNHILSHILERYKTIGFNPDDPKDPF